MRLGPAVALFAAFISSYDRGGAGVHAAATDEEPLLRRREQLKDDEGRSAGYVYEAGRTWQAHNDRRAAQEQETSSFYRYSADYGTDEEELGRYDYSKGNKSGKGTSYSPLPYGTKSGKKGEPKGGSKGKGSKNMYPPPYDAPMYYAPVKEPPRPHYYRPTSRPPPPYYYYQPVKAPVHAPSQSPDCPDPDPPEKCIYDESRGKESCKDPKLTCQKSCLPALCKVEPHGPTKYHDGHAYDPPIAYVPIGSTCKWWEYATSSSRGEPEICCELKEYSDYDPPGCGVCYDCQFPQVVNEACCAFHTGPPKHHDSEHDPDYDNRSGEYEGCPDGKVCCKCGTHSYKCILDDEYHQCDANVCGFEPSPKPSHKPTSRPIGEPSPTPGPTEPPTGCIIGVNMTTCVVTGSGGTSCDEFVPAEDACEASAVFQSTVTNEGATDNITKVELSTRTTDQGGNTIDSATTTHGGELPPGEATDISSPNLVTIDFCKRGNVTFAAEATGEPGGCTDNDELIVEIEGRCDIFANITCQNTNIQCPCKDPCETECFKFVECNYSATNVGQEPLLYTSLFIDGGGLDQIDEDISLNPSEASDPFSLDRCVNVCSEFTTTARVVGNPGECQANNTFVLQT